MTIATAGILMVGGSMLVALAVQTVVRRRVSLEVLEAHHTVAGHLLGLVGGMFGILLAFAVVVVWEQYDRAREGAAREASAAADLYRLVRSFPAPDAERLGAELGEYIHAIIDDEWERLARGGASPLAQRELDDVWQMLTRLRPTDDGSRNLQLVALQRLADLTDLRRQRLGHAEHQMPEVLWAVLVVGAVLTVGFANFFGLPFRRTQAAMIASLAGLIALAIFTIWVLDNPYRGSTRVHPADFELVLRLLAGNPGGA